MTEEQKARKREIDKAYRARRVLTDEQKKRNAEKAKRYLAKMSSGARATLLNYKREYNAAYVLTADQRSAMRGRSAAWYAANKERKATRQREWLAANPEAARIYAQTRRARKRESEATLSRNIVQVLFERQCGQCVACRADLSRLPYEIDHITPLAAGGSDADENVQLLCRTCNRQKGAKDPVVFMQQKGYLL